MIEAKKGIILIAKLTKAPIVPIGIWGSEKLLPINKDGDMAKEKWNHADVHIKIGETIIIPEKEKNEDKHQYENRILNSIMTGIAKQLPKEYRGFYS
jgi:1-acyl-sn-glycerol-3-phosphate acyltransferase